MAGGGGRVGLYDMVTGAERRELRARGSAITGLACTPDGRRVAALDGAGFLSVWDAGTGRQLRRTRVVSRGGRIALSPNGRRLAALSRGRTDMGIALVDLDTGRVVDRIDLMHPGEQVVFHPDGQSLFARAGVKRVHRWSVGGRLMRTYPRGDQTREHKKEIVGLAVASSGRSLVTADVHHELRLWNVRTGREAWRYRGFDGALNAVDISPDGDWVLASSEDLTVRLLDARTGKEALVISQDEARWVVADPQGRYDGSHLGRVPFTHAVQDLGVLAIEQVRGSQYRPGLLGQTLGLTEEGPAPVAAPPPAPTIEARQGDDGGMRIAIRAENQGGGIGAVTVHLNGKQIVEDARGGTVAVDADSADMQVDITDLPQVLPGAQNRVEVRASNADGTAQSRGAALDFEAPGEPRDPQFWAIVCGVSDYAGDALDLGFAAKDAQDFAKALQIAAESLFTAERTHIQLLAAPTPAGGVLGTKANLEAAFEAAMACQSEDIFVIYLAGHGVIHTSPAGSKDYHFLLQEATSSELDDDDVREAVALSGAELAHWIARVPAVRRQALFLDTCAAGGVRDALTAFQASAALVSELHDTAGIHVLAGCAEDRAAYESAAYGQGLLTYALLHGLSCGCRFVDDDLIDARELISYVRYQVPTFAENAGLSAQQPVTLESDETFNLGRLPLDLRDEIPLQTLKPQVVKSKFELSRRPSDPARLSRAVDRAVRTHDPEASGRPAMVAVQTTDMVWAYRIAGRYRIVDGQAEVTVFVDRFLPGGEEEPVSEFTMEGLADTPERVDALAAQIVQRAYQEIDEHFGEAD